MTGELTRLLVLGNTASTLLLVGLIWFVQVVHYPQLKQVGQDCFPEYEASHVRLTTRVVAGPMLVEALTAALLAWRPPSRELAGACGVGLTLVVVIWLSTAFLQVPCHQALAKAFDAHVHRQLVRSNWVRTAGWSARGALMLSVLGQLPAR